MRRLTTERLIVRQLRRPVKPEKSRYSKAARQYLDQLQDTYQSQLTREMRLIRFPENPHFKEDSNYAS